MVWQAGRPCPLAQRGTCPMHFATASALVLAVASWPAPASVPTLASASASASASVPASASLPTFAPYRDAIYSQLMSTVW